MFDIIVPKSKVYLSRRNLLTLLAKLDRLAEGDATECAIIKSDNEHPKYPQTMKSIMVVAIEDDEYYGSSGRNAGEMHPKEEATLKNGVTYDTV